MRYLRSLIIALGMGGALAIAGCGSIDTGMPSIQSLPKLLKKPAPAVLADEGAIAAEALARTPLPSTLVVIEGRKTTTTVLLIEQNGIYETWASSDRRTITLVNGMITATRGLGQDIMSSETGASRELLAARRGGVVQRTQRYLDGENQTVELVADCQITRGGTFKVAAGEISTSAVLMQERCSAEDTQFANEYSVDSRGRVVQSRQWLGPRNGYITLKRLRF